MFQKKYIHLWHRTQWPFPTDPQSHGSWGFIKFHKRPTQGETLRNNPGLEIPIHITMVLWAKDNFNVKDVPFLKTQLK